jgi:hypothetical protein
VLLTCHEYGQRFVASAVRVGEEGFMQVNKLS